MIRTADLSACGKYRNHLTRVWDARLPRLAFLMFNPSTADANKDDHTITKCIGIAARQEFGSIVVVNLFAFRSTDPYQIACIAKHGNIQNAIGVDNLATLERVGREVSDVICAWGCENVTRRLPGFKEHADLCVRLVAARTGAQQIGPPTKTGSPRHPLTVPYTSPLIPFEVFA